MTNDELYNSLFEFAKSCQKLVKQLQYTVYNIEYSKQLIRSSASPEANYIEAIEAMSKKDFIYRLKICRKETKEAIYWLMLIQNTNEDLSIAKIESQKLVDEARGFIRIFTASILTSEKNQKAERKK